MKTKKTFLVLDGNALLHRAWHAIPPLTSPDGRVVNAAYGFTNVVEKMRTEFKPDFMAVAWDLPGGTFRHEAFEAYKATREKKAPELYEQIAYIQEILTAYNVPSLSVPGMEADDILGTLAKTYGPKADVAVKILTGDLDALQLVDDDVEVVVFIKGLSETKVYNKTAVQERYGLLPSQLIDLKTLMGDTSDNIPGVAGIGKKTAEDLLKQYGSISEIYAAIERGDVPEKFAKKFRGQEEVVKQMRRLVTVVTNVDLGDFTVEQAAVREPDVAVLKEKFREFGFRRLLEKYEGNQGSDVESRKSEVVDRKKKTEVSMVTDVSLLNMDQLVITLGSGQQDLFAGGQEIAFFDGEKAYITTDVKEALDVMARAKVLIGHDVKAILHVLLPTSYNLPPVLFDTMVAAYLLAPGTRAFDVATSAYEHLKRTVPSDISVALKAHLIFDLYGVLKTGLQKEGMQKLAEEIEMPLIPVLFNMEKTGILVDQNRLAELSKRFATELELLTKNIYKAAGREFNINSPSQLAEVLFVDLQLPTKGIKKTKTGFSTAAPELDKLADAHEIVKMVGEYREFAKLKSTYVDALPLLIAKDGRIHTSYNQTVAATGRLSSSDPNLQNIPIRTALGNEIRKAFVAEEGAVLVSIDYSQFELRIAASIAHDESFLRAFHEGADIHVRTAAEVLDKKEEDVTKQERSAAKAINFGILYGMGPRNLAKTTGFSQEEARAFLDRYFAVHAGIAQYIETMKTLAHKREYAETLFGRKRYLPDINSGVQMLVAGAERMAVNMPVQGTQADLIKIAMIHVAKWIETEAPDVRMLLQVHDELVFEVPEGRVEAVLPVIRNIMESVWESDVPLVVEAEVGKNWGEGEVR